MLGHDHDARCAGARLSRTPRVMAVQEVVEPGHVRGMRRCSRVAELLEVEDAGRLERLEQRGDQSR